MDLGANIKSEKAQKALLKVRPDLLPGEEVLCFVQCRSTNPSFRFLLISNARILGLTPSLPYFDLKMLLRKIETVAYDATSSAGMVTVEVGRDLPIVIKGIGFADMRLVRETLEGARLNPTEVPERAAGVEKFSAKERRAEHRSRQADLTAKREAEDQARHGPVAVRGGFGGATVSIYENGFIHVARLIGGSSRPERLLSIEFSGDVTKKTGVGRAVGFVASAGLSAMSSNQRGDLYLTITTESKTYVLHQDPPTARDITTGKKLEAAGRAVLP